MINLNYSEVVVLLTRIIPLEKDPEQFKEDGRMYWEQVNLNRAIKKIEDAARKMQKERGSGK